MMKEFTLDAAFKAPGDINLEERGEPVKEPHSDIDYYPNTTELLNHYADVRLNLDTYNFDEEDIETWGEDRWIKLELQTHHVGDKGGRFFHTTIGIALSTEDAKAICDILNFFLSQRGRL